MVYYVIFFCVGFQYIIWEICYQIISSLTFLVRKKQF